MSGTLLIEGLPVVSQLMCGVHTENGLDIGSNNTMLLDTKSTKIAEEVQELNSFKTTFFERILHSIQSKENMNSKIIEILQDCIKLLNKTTKASCLVYDYGGEKDKMMCQEIILDLATECLKTSESSSAKVRNLCLEVIKVSLERSEFDLNSLSINEKADSDVISARLKVCKKYLDFLTICLEYSLNKLARKVHDKEIKDFVEFFLTQAFFRLPQFRRAFLATICPGTTKTDYNTSAINTAIDWEVLFHEKLEKYPDIDTEEIKENIDKIIKDINWEDRVAKKGLCFLGLTRRLVEFIQKKLVIQVKIQWNDIPGFDVIVEELLKIIELRDVARMPLPMVDTLAAFISDSSICNRFIGAVIRKTKFDFKQCARH